MAFKIIETQEDFDRAIQERLNRQKESIEEQYADYAELKEENTTLTAEVETLTKAQAENGDKYANYDVDLLELKNKVAGYETSNLRTKIAMQYGIPYDLASRIVGEDEASITADAKKLAELVVKAEPIAPLRNTEPEVNNKDGAYKSLLENLNLKGE